MHEHIEFRYVLPRPPEDRARSTVPRLPPLIACMTSPHEIDEVAPKGVHELEQGWGRNSVQL